RTGFARPQRQGPPAPPSPPQPPAVPAPAPIFVPLAPEGRIILAAGALMSPRLLLLSGVGPFHLHDQIFDDGFSVPFHISNPGIGAGLFDHMATSLTYEYTGSTPPYQAYHYDDYAANATDLAKYVASRSGPYAQYGPVSVMQGYLRTRWLEPEEIFTKGRTRQPKGVLLVTPLAVGAPSGPYSGPRALSAYAMLRRPRPTALMRIDKDSFIKAPPIYLTDIHDLDLLTRAIQQLILM